MSCIILTVDWRYQIEVEFVAEFFAAKKQISLFNKRLELAINKTIDQLKEIVHLF